MGGITLRPNETLHYSRPRDLADATLLRARYGPFRWEKHVHDELVIVISEKGAGECRTRRGSDTGGPGSVWVFAPGEYHYGQVYDGGEWQYRALYLDEGAMRRLTSRFDPEAKGLYSLAPGLHADPHVWGLFLHAMRQAQRADNRASEETIWNDAFHAVFERYGEPKPRLAPSDLGPSALERSRDHVLRNFREEISVDDLARLCGVSRFHFIRSFRNRFGLPPHAYINQVRLQHARKLLIKGSSATLAAAESGFYDQSRLTHLFRRCYGVTPAQYAALERR